jgi:hypothetical protein
MYTGFIVCVTSLDPDQSEHPSHLIWIYSWQTQFICQLIWIYAGHILVKNYLMNLKADSVDPLETAQMCQR